MLDHPVRVDSRRGEGATFSIDTPLVAAGIVRGAPVAVPPRGIAVRNVLVLDNERAILDGMRAMLRGWGVRVRTAATLAGARRIVRRANGAIDVILADYHLGDGQVGDEAVAVLRRDLGYDVPAVIITADRMPDLRERLTGDGLHVLQKPLKPAQLRALLARIN